MYDKNYSNTNLVIPGEIWNNKSIKGMQKVILALIKKLTHNGTQEIDMMTRKLAQITSTREDDIKYNLKQLHKKKLISITQNPVSTTGYSIVYTYKVQPTKPASTDTSSLF